MKWHMAVGFLWLVSGSAFANFSGSDNFNDNSRDTGTWDVLFEMGTDRYLEETNGRLEMRSSAVEVGEPRSGAWRWVGNTGSVTQDWTITYHTYNAFDGSGMEGDLWFGFLVSPDAAGDIENNAFIEVTAGNYGTASKGYGSGMTLNDEDVEATEVDVAVTNDFVTLRMQYDAFTQMIHCSYDQGHGFVDAGMHDASIWNIGPSDEFHVYFFGGGEKTAVASGEVYGDDVVMIPTSEYIEPPTLLGHPNFSGSDDFNDDAIDSTKWGIYHDGNQAQLTEVNGRFEFTSPAAGTDEDARSAAYEWVANQGSYTQSWAITFQAVNTIDENSLGEGIENWFGLLVATDLTLENSINLSFGKEKFGGEARSEVEMEANTNDVEILEVALPVTNDVVWLRVSYDSLTHELVSEFNQGGGFVELERFDVDEWGMDEDDRFRAIFFSGNNGMIVNSAEIYADRFLFEPHAHHLHETGEELASHIQDLEIYVGYDLPNGVYQIEFDLEGDGTFREVWVDAPFGLFDCEEDYNDWEYEENEIPTNAIPDVDGDWNIVVIRTNGLSSTTAIPFMQLDGVSPLPVVSTCPILTSPVLPEDDWILAQDVTFEWDSDFDSNANLAGIEGWNEVSDVDLVFVEYEGTLPTTRSFGPVSFDGGLVEVWIFNLFGVESTTDDGVPYELGRYAYRASEIKVIEPEWDEDLDGMSNEWELKYYGGVTNGNPAADGDSDGNSNLMEFRHGTNPTNSASSYTQTLAANHLSDELEFGWTAAPGYFYDVYWSSNLVEGFELVAEDLVYPHDSFTNSLQGAGFFKVETWRDVRHPNAVARHDISIDGDLSDWSGISAQLSDPSGDAQISGVDITGVTIATGVSSLFYKIDRAGTALPDGEDVSMNIRLESGGRGVGYALSLYMDEFSTNASLQRIEGDDTWVYLTQVDELEFNGSAIEMAVPLDQMEFIDRYGINFYSHHTVEQAWLSNGDYPDNSAVIIMPY